MACFGPRLDEYAAALDEALAAPDAWTGFCAYAERVCGMQAADRATQDLLTTAFPTAREVEAQRAQGVRAVRRAVRRAQDEGALRAGLRDGGLRPAAPRQRRRGAGDAGGGARGVAPARGAAARRLPGRRPAAGPAARRRPVARADLPRDAPAPAPPAAARRGAARARRARTLTLTPLRPGTPNRTTIRRGAGAGPSGGRGQPRRSRVLLGERTPPVAVAQVDRPHPRGDRRRGRNLPQCRASAGDSPPREARAAPAGLHLRVCTCGSMCTVADAGGLWRPRRRRSRPRQTETHRAGKRTRTPRSAAPSGERMVARFVLPPQAAPALAPTAGAAP